MSESYGIFPRRYREGIFGAISAGFVFLLIGAIIILTPNLIEEVLDFFRDFQWVTIPNTGIAVPAPSFSRAPHVYEDVFGAVEQFSFAVGVFQLVILALRFFAGSPWDKRAETASNFVFWIGAGYLTRTILIEATRWSAVTAWFVFWSGIVMVLGLSLIVRAIILAAVYPRRTI